MNNNKKDVYQILNNIQTQSGGGGAAEGEKSGASGGKSKTAQPVAPPIKLGSSADPGKEKKPGRYQEKCC